MDSEEIYYTIALSRLSGISQAMSAELYRTLGSGKAVYEQHREQAHWDDALHRAAAEMDFITKNNIRVLTMQDDDYPARLRECPDAPIILFYKGTADLNQRRVINLSLIHI